MLHTRPSQLEKDLMVSQFMLEGNKTLLLMSNNLPEANSFFIAISNQVCFLIRIPLKDSANHYYGIMGLNTFRIEIVIMFMVVW